MSNPKLSKLIHFIILQRRFYVSDSLNVCHGSVKPGAIYWEGVRSVNAKFTLDLIVINAVFELNSLMELWLCFEMIQKPELQVFKI